MWLPFLSAAWERPFSPPATYKIIHLLTLFWDQPERLIETIETPNLLRCLPPVLSEAACLLQRFVEASDSLKNGVRPHFGQKRRVRGNRSSSCRRHQRGWRLWRQNLWRIWRCSWRRRVSMNSYIDILYVHLVFILLLQYLHRSSGRASGQHLDSLKSNLKK